MRREPGALRRAPLAPALGLWVLLGAACNGGGGGPSPTGDGGRIDANPGSAPCSQDSDCSSGSVCDRAAGTCEAMCDINGALIAAKSVNPANACQSCQPAVQTSTWSPLPDGTGCAAESVCHGGACQLGCYIGGSYQAPNAVDPGNACQVCRPAANLSGWSALSDGTSCAAGSVCQGASCKPGCYIGGAYQAPDALDPLNPCQSCQQAIKITDWTAVADGRSCGSGGACASGSCLPRFSFQTSGTRNILYRVWGSGPNDVYAVGATATIQHTANGGTTWTSQTSAVGGMGYYVYGVWGSGPGDVYSVVSGDGGTPQRTVDGGKTWTAQTKQGIFLYGLWGSGPADVYATGDYGRLLHTTNSGMTWSQQTTPSTNSLLNVWGSGANDVYAVGLSGTIVHTGNGGTTWTSQTSGTGQNLYGVWGSSLSNDVYVVGDQGTILHTTSGGATWAPQYGGANLLYSVWGSSPNEVYAVGWKGTILRTVDAGKHWVSLTSGTTNDLYGVWGSGPDDVYVVGAEGTVLHHP